MKITAFFESYEEMKAFAADLLKLETMEQAVENKKEPAAACEAKQEQTTSEVPVQTVQPSVVQPVVQPAVVPTTTKSYTLDELAGAAMTLMDKGMQAQLQSLIAGYGVEALPMLPQEQYGSFATALRGLGAQI